MNNIDYKILGSYAASCSVVPTILYSGVAIHELGHKWTYNAFFPGLVNKMKIGVCGGYVEWNFLRYFRLLDKGFSCTQTRMKLASGIAGGPIAGLIFNIGLATSLYNIRENQKDDRIYSWPILSAAFYTAYFNIWANISNVINVHPDMDGPKFFSLIFTKRINFYDPYLIKKLTNIESFQNLVINNILPESSWPKTLEFCHEWSSDKLEDSFEIKQKDLELLKKETESIYRKSSSINGNLRVAGHYMHWSICIVAMGILFKNEYNKQN